MALNTVTTLKARLKAAEAENAMLKERLGATEPMTVTTWEKIATQQLRDEFAARALFSCWGSSERALKVLGFKFEMKTKAGMDELNAMGERIFDTPGVKAILARDFSDAKATWDLVLERTRQTAIHGSDDAQIRAAMLLAKIGGHVNEQPIVNTTVNLYELMGKQFGEGEKRVGSDRPAIDAIEETDPLRILSHEPSETGIRIESDDDTVNAAIAGGSLE